MGRYQFTETDRQTDTDRQTHRHTHRQRQIQRERDKERQKDTETKRRQRQTHRQRQRHKETQREKETETESYVSISDVYKTALCCVQKPPTQRLINKSWRAAQEQRGLSDRTPTPSSLHPLPPSLPQRGTKHFQFRIFTIWLRPPPPPPALHLSTPHTPQPTFLHPTARHKTLSIQNLYHPFSKESFHFYAWYIDE